MSRSHNLDQVQFEKHNLEEEENKAAALSGQLVPTTTKGQKDENKLSQMY